MLDHMLRISQRIIAKIMLPSRGDLMANA